MFTSVFLLNVVYFSVCLTSNKLYWIEDQLADVSTRFYTLASWTIGELTVIRSSHSWSLGCLCVEWLEKGNLCLMDAFTVSVT